MCVQELRTDFKPETTGQIYCEIHNGTKCIPTDNDRFICECNEGFQWSNFTQNCEYITNCLFKFCNENEVCYEDEVSKEAICRCKLNYFRDESSKKCEFNLCKSLPKEKQCEKNEKCVTVFGEKERRCICPLTNKIKDRICLDEKLIDNPLIKQLFKCSQTYKVVNNKIDCDCFPGYKLDEQDKQTCLGDLSSKCKSECDPRQICAFNIETKKHECRCQLGFSGSDCQKKYCDIADRDEIKHICGYETCIEKKFRNQNKVGFVCNCDKRVAMEDEENGLCTLKQVCTKEKEEECKAKNAICLPILDSLDRHLYQRCLCPKGQDFDKAGKCKDVCEVDVVLLPKKSIYKDDCLIDFKNNPFMPSWHCRPGFALNNETGKCDVGRNLLKVSFDFKYRNLDNEANEKEQPSIEYSTDEYYCNHLSIKLDCVERLNANRKKEKAILDSDFLKNFKFQIANSIKTSFKNLIEPSLIKRIAIDKITNNGDIDYENKGLNSIYSIDLFIEIEDKANMDTIKENLNQICLPDNFNQEPDGGAKKGAKTSLLIDKKSDKKQHCVIRPYIYLINSEMKIVDANLCEKSLEKAKIDCNGNSNCVRNDSTNAYSCKCSNGFETRFTAKEFNIEFNSCTDIDECESVSLNNCDVKTTNCENLLGTYRCNCKGEIDYYEK